MPSRAAGRLRILDRLRDAALPAGLALAFILVVAGFISGDYGLVGLGVVIGLTGYFSRPRDD
jgi:hypothetical protein